MPSIIYICDESAKLISDPDHSEDEDRFIYLAGSSLGVESDILSLGPKWIAPYLKFGNDGGIADVAIMKVFWS